VSAGSWPHFARIAESARWIVGAGYVVGRVQIVLICTVADLIELDPVTVA